MYHLDNFWHKVLAQIESAILFVSRRASSEEDRERTWCWEGSYSSIHQLWFQDTIKSKCLKIQFWVFIFSTGRFSTVWQFLIQSIGLLIWQPCI